MENLYAIMEQLIDVEYKLKCITNVLHITDKRISDVEMSDLQSVISVALDSLERTSEKQKSAVSALDSYIAENASKFRNTDEN